MLLFAAATTTTTTTNTAAAVVTLTVLVYCTGGILYTVYLYYGIVSCHGVIVVCFVLSLINARCSQI